jgi:hypothetical protein
MKTFNEMHDDLNRSGNPCAYWGESGDWLVSYGRHRDSDLLTQSNWHTFIELLNELGKEDAYTIERENHWAVGWVEYILINPKCKEAIALAEDVQRRLNDYPVLNEDDWSERESDARHEYWCEHGGKQDFVRDIAKHFDLGDIATEGLSAAPPGQMLEYLHTNNLITGEAEYIHWWLNDMTRQDIANLLREARKWDA